VEKEIKSALEEVDKIAEQVKKDIMAAWEWILYLYVDASRVEFCSDVTGGDCRFRKAS
jgi:hypothetical protein